VRRFGRILIVGATGQVGRELQRSFAGTGEIISANRKHADLTAQNQVRDLVRDTQPDLIVNAAAYTAVDRAESEPEIAMAINADAPRVLAEEAQRRNILLVHYSTDYVFDGTRTGPWVETDQPNPVNVYGVSKLAGEEAIRQVGGNFLIFRTSWVYGPHGKNFLLTMLRLGRERDHLNVVDDQIGAPTTSVELADVTRKVVEGVSEGRFGPPEAWAGVYHMTCGGETSWFGFAREIFSLATKEFGVTPKLNPIASADYPTPAKRPRNSVLSNEKLSRTLGLSLKPWNVALSDVMQMLSPVPQNPR
jgi:dTDP-4-dehydrorhamnose reductase